MLCTFYQLIVTFYDVAHPQDKFIPVIMYVITAINSHSLPNICFLLKGKRQKKKKKWLAITEKTTTSNLCILKTYLCQKMFCSSDTGHSFQKCKQKYLLTGNFITLTIIPAYLQLHIIITVIEKITY